jgi:hypothetical protein
LTTASTQTGCQWPTQFQLGAAGGGALEFRAGGQLSVLGIIDARGGSGVYGIHCASGGGIKFGSVETILVAAYSCRVDGGVTQVGGTGSAGNGRWAIQSWNGTKSNGTTPSIPAGIY